MQILKKTLILVFINLLAAESFGQNNKPAFLKLGYSSTNIDFNEALRPGNTVGGLGIAIGLLDAGGKTFTGEGVEIGYCKTLNNRIFIDFSASMFSGNGKSSGPKGLLDYTLKGFQIPISFNYLLNKSERKLRINAGVGLQYLNARLQQFEPATNSSIQKQLTDIPISELQFLFRPGLQYQFTPRLFAAFIVNVSISTNGRYTDHPCFSLKYALTKSKVN